MKVTFGFDKTSRSLTLTPEDDLEALVCKEISERAGKGAQLKIRSIATPGISQESFVVELQTNGH